MKSLLPAIADATQLPNDSPRDLAQRIATRLMRTYRGTLCQRLVLTDDNPPMDYGGLCFEAIVDQVEKVLSGNEGLSDHG